jgi:Tol biopolymer transport system component
MASIPIGRAFQPVRATLLVALLPAGVRAQDTYRVSVDSAAVQASGDSYSWAISADGSLVTFGSFAADLVAGDTNGVMDVFVHDARNGTTERVSVDSSGVEGDADSANASMSADGRCIAFDSWASNLGGGGAGMELVYVHDRTTGGTELVSVDSAGTRADSYSGTPAISADGNVVGFPSFATNLVAGDTNGTWDVFVHDRTTGVTERVTVDPSGNDADGSSYGFVALSSDGRYVAFQSDATNLVAGDKNGVTDVFVRDRVAGTTERVSVGGGGGGGNDFSGLGRAAITADGRFVAFHSLATNLVAGDGNGVQDVFVRDRANGTTEIVSVDSNGVQGDDWSSLASISSDGARVAFESPATNLVAGDGNGVIDVFVHDRGTGATDRASLTVSGAEATAHCSVPILSGDGASVTFTSSDPGLVAHDTNDKFDVFVRGACPTLAAWANFGAGYPGTNGVPDFTAEQNPVLGSTITLDLANSSGSASMGIVVLGFLRADIHSVWGGDLLVAPMTVVGLPIPAVGATVAGAIPNDPSLAATALDLQALEVDAGATHGVAFTAGLTLLFGS